MKEAERASRRAYLEEVVKNNVTATTDGKYLLGLTPRGAAKIATDLKRKDEGKGRKISVRSSRKLLMELVLEHKVRGSIFPDPALGKIIIYSARN